jgi:hypothetical protein
MHEPAIGYSNGDCRAQNVGGGSTSVQRGTGVLCVERDERICADMARLAALVCRRSVRAFGARRSGADRQICSGALVSRGVDGLRDRPL